MNPVEFSRDILHLTPWARQEEVLRALAEHDRVSVRSGHGVGKTMIAAVAALWYLAEHDPCCVLTTAPTDRQVREALWRKIRELWRNSALSQIYPHVQVNQRNLDITTRRWALGFSTDDPQMAQGMREAENLLIIVDEAGGMDPEIFISLRSMLTVEGAKLLLIGNPIVPEGYFYESHQPGANFHQIAISSLESPNVQAGKIVVSGLTTAEWCDEMLAEWGERSPVYQSRVLGEFPEVGEDTLVPKPWAAAALERGNAWNGNGPDVDTETIALGCDVARYGADLTVICIADKHGLRHMEARAKASLMDTVGRVKRLREEWNVPETGVAVDDTGVGGGVTDRLWELDVGVAPINFGERAIDHEHYANKRTEIYWNMREALNPEKGATFGIPERFREAVRELSVPHYAYTSKGQIKLESKDDIKKRLGKSPDHADALALCFAPRAPSMRLERL